MHFDDAFHDVCIILSISSTCSMTGAKLHFTSVQVEQVRIYFVKLFLDLNTQLG